MKICKDFSNIATKALEALKKAFPNWAESVRKRHSEKEPKYEAYFDTGKYQKDHKQWEIDEQRIDDLFEQIKTAIDEELKSRNAGYDDEEIKLLTGAPNDWQGRQVADIFIDDIIKYADGQNAPLFDTLKRVFEKAEKEDFSALPKEQRNAVEKRKEELRQLVVRGRNMVNTGTAPEYADEVLRMTYEMSKEGLREALRFDISGVSLAYPSTAVEISGMSKVDFDKMTKELGWFLSMNGEKREIGGNTFGSFTEYVASKCDRDLFNKMEKINEAQGRFSYFPEPVYRKFLVLKSMGYDYRNYDTWQDMKRDLESSGFFVNAPKNEFPQQFAIIKHKPEQEFDAMMKTQVVFDSAIQLVLENTTNIPGIDKATQTAVVIRTEDKGIPSLKGARKGVNLKDTGYASGVCESHGHITASHVAGTGLTVTRVPFSRVHAVWFMERGKLDSGKRYQSVYSSNPDPKKLFQFWGYHQNEMDVCSQGLPVIFVGDIDSSSQDQYTASMKSATYDTSRKILEEWEKKHPTETTVKAMESK